MPFYALASEPMPKQLGLQPAATPVMEQLTDFHNFILVIITAITLFVLALLIFIVIRFNAKANPEPQKFSHNTLIEVIWTVIPIVILIVIAIPSFKLLYYMDRTADPEMTLNVTGYQWYWGYEYPDHDGLFFESLMLEDDELADGQPRLLATDTDVVVPVNATVRLQITSEDVIHAWAIPSFGVKMDAVPGRLNETWFRATEVGTYYGQCSELCGIRHAYMPITVKVVTQEEFDEWILWAKEEYAAAPAAYDVADVQR